MYIYNGKRRQTLFSYLSKKNLKKYAIRKGLWNLNSLQNIKDVEELIEIKHIVDHPSGEGHSEYKVDVKTGQRMFIDSYNYVI